MGKDDELGILVSDECQVAVVSFWEPGGARVLACALWLLDASKGQEKGEPVGAMWVSSAGKFLVVAYHQLDCLGRWREGAAKISLLGLSGGSRCAFP